MSTDLITFQDRSLEDLRRLLTLKDAVASPDFEALADGLENASLREALVALRGDAEAERAELVSVLQDWMRAGGSADEPEVGSREIVTQWADLHEASGRRMRYAAGFAPSQALRKRLLALAERDERHARDLRALL